MFSCAPCVPFRVSGCNGTPARAGQLSSGSRDRRSWRRNTICTASRLPHLRAPGRSLASLPVSARSRLRACLSAARLSTFLASSPFRALLSPRLANLFAGLLSWGWPAPDGYPPGTCPPPLHRHIRRASTPGDRSHLRPRSSQLRSPVPPSWFLTTSTVSSARRPAGLLHPAAGPGVRHVSDREIGFPISRTLPAARPPLEGHHHPTAVTRSLAPATSLTFFLDSCPAYPCGWDRARIEAVVYEALLRGEVSGEAPRCRVVSTLFLPGLLSSPRCCAAVSRSAALSPGRKTGSARRR